ncbi:RICIN domain-containing protein [Nonomuraea typhae]|uniref:RICIN domain-containing protein n=1 Tax=Nonomuraea typhae TaxID=2603600 RepID=A0ABW7Z061_9ACTN
MTLARRMAIAAVLTLTSTLINVIGPQAARAESTYPNVAIYSYADGNYATPCCTDPRWGGDPGPPGTPIISMRWTGDGARNPTAPQFWTWHGESRPYSINRETRGWLEMPNSGGEVLDFNQDRNRSVDGTSYFAQLWQDNGSLPQRWILRRVGTSARFNIVSQLDGGCLTNNSGNALGVWACTGAENQVFGFWESRYGWWS